MTPWLKDFVLTRIEQQQSSIHNATTVQSHSSSSLSNLFRPRMVQILSRGGDWFLCQNNQTTNNNSNKKDAWFIISDGHHSIQAVLSESCRKYIWNQMENCRQAEQQQSRQQEEKYLFLEYSRHCCGLIQNYDLVVEVDSKNSNTTAIRSTTERDPIYLTIHQWDVRSGGISDVLFRNPHDQRERHQIIEPIQNNVDVRHLLQDYSLPTTTTNTTAANQSRVLPNNNKKNNHKKMILGDVQEALDNDEFYETLLELAKQQARQKDDITRHPSSLLLSSSSSSLRTNSNNNTATATSAQRSTQSTNKKTNTNNDEEMENEQVYDSDQESDEVMDIDDVLATQPDDEVAVALENNNPLKGDVSSTQKANKTTGQTLGHQKIQGMPHHATHEQEQENVDSTRQEQQQAPPPMTQNSVTSTNAIDSSLSPEGIPFHTTRTIPYNHESQSSSQSQFSITNRDNGSGFLTQSPGILGQAKRSLQPPTTLNKEMTGQQQQQSQLYFTPKSASSQAHNNPTNIANITTPIATETTPTMVGRKRPATLGPTTVTTKTDSTTTSTTRPKKRPRYWESLVQQLQDATATVLSFASDNSPNAYLRRKRNGLSQWLAKNIIPTTTTTTTATDMSNNNNNDNQNSTTTTTTTTTKPKPSSL